MKTALTFLQLFKKSFGLFSDFKGLKLSAALSYYTVFSFCPFLIVVISLAGIFFGQEAVEGRIYHQIAGLIGTESADQIEQIIRNIEESNHGVIGSIIGFVVLLFGASGVFSEIQDSINYIWSLQPKKTKFWKILLTRKLLSFALLIAIAFLLLVSLTVSALVDLLSMRLKTYFDDSVIKLFGLVNTVVIPVVVCSLFTVIFKVLPNAVIRWKDAIVGSFLTSILFLLGKFIIGFYLGNSKIGQTYGATATIVVLMLWVYYSSIILYFGACFTRAYAEHYGRKITSRDE